MGSAAWFGPALRPVRGGLKTLSRLGWLGCWCLCAVSGCASRPGAADAPPEAVARSGETSPLAAVAEAEAWYADGLYAQAAEAFQTLAQGSPRNAYFWFRLGSCRLQLRQHGPAIAALAQAVALDPHEGRFTYNLAMAHSAVARDAFAQAHAQLPASSPWRSAAQQPRLWVEAVVGPPRETSGPP